MYHRGNDLLWVKQHGSEQCSLKAIDQPRNVYLDGQQVSGCSFFAKVDTPKSTSADGLQDLKVIYSHATDVIATCAHSRRGSTYSKCDRVSEIELVGCCTNLDANKQIQNVISSGNKCSDLMRYKTGCQARSSSMTVLCITLHH